MTKKNRITRGFTLLEVLIAVLILGIIATAAIPLVSDYAERARDAQIEANTQAVEMASQRYELVHKVPLGYSVDTSTDTLIDIFGDDGAGFWMQLVNPTDVNGNILGASLDPTANAFVYGPYLAPGSAEPASLLFGATVSRKDGPVMGQAPLLDPATRSTNRMFFFRPTLSVSLDPAGHGTVQDATVVSADGAMLALFDPNDRVPTSIAGFLQDLVMQMRRGGYGTWHCGGGRYVLCAVTMEGTEQQTGLISLGGRGPRVYALRDLERVFADPSRAASSPTHVHDVSIIQAAEGQLKTLQLLRRLGRGTAFDKLEDLHVPGIANMPLYRRFVYSNLQQQIIDRQFPSAE